MKKSHKPFKLKSAFQIEEDSNESLPTASTASTTSTIQTTPSIIPEDIKVDAADNDDNNDSDDVLIYIDNESERIKNLEKKVNILIILVLVLILIIIFQNKKNRQYTN